MTTRVGSHLGDRIVAVGIDTNEGHTAITVIEFQCNQAGCVELRKGTLGPQEGQDDDRPVGDTRERVALAPVVIEREVGHLTTDPRRTFGRHYRTAADTDSQQAYPSATNQFSRSSSCSRR